MSIWEFSGYQPYFLLFDHFIGDPNCIHMVCFSLMDSQEDQLAQLIFWFDFIKARIALMEPLGEQLTHSSPEYLSYSFYNYNASTLNRGIGMNDAKHYVKYCRKTFLASPVKVCF